MRLIEETIADFSEKGSTNNLQSYVSFVQQITYVDPSQTQKAIAPVNRLLQIPGADIGNVVRIQIGDQTVSLTSTENSLLNMLRSMTMRPELLLRTLSSMPQIKAKVDQIGGIDAFLNPAASRVFSSISPDGSMSGRIAVGFAPPVQSAQASAESQDRIFRELKGKAERNPAVVRQKLLKEFGKPEQIQSLISMAQRSSYEDPDLGSLCLEQAKTLLPQITPLQQRASSLQQLISACRNVDGEVDIGLIREGFILADQMREEMKVKESSNPGTSPRSGFTRQGPADYLEAALTAEYAREDFDAAMRFIRSLPDDPAKLQMYTQLIQALRNPL